jgi:hypothetical protein
MCACLHAAAWSRRFCQRYMVRFFLVHKKTRCEFFCEQDLISSALPEPALSVVEWGDIPCHMRDRLISLSIGRFTGFVHFVVFVVQTPTA